MIQINVSELQGLLENLDAGFTGINMTCFLLNACVQVREDRSVIKFVASTSIYRGENSSDIDYFSLL